MQILPKFSLHLSLKKVKKVLKIDIFCLPRYFDPWYRFYIR